MEIISIINNKGGVGKTTTAHNLGVGLVREGYKVGLLDLDSQANLSFSVKHDQKSDLRSLLLAKKTLKMEDFSPTYKENMFIISNNKDITTAVFNQVKQFEQIILLKKLLENFDALDVVIIDTPPTLDLPTINAMVASTKALIPVQYDIYSATGLSTLIENIQEMKSAVNQELEIAGILVTRVDNRQVLNQHMKQAFEHHYKDLILDTIIRTNSRLSQAQADNQDIFDYGDLKGMEDYTNLTREMMSKLNLKKPSKSSKNQFVSL
jgi:chromosome partitioning protein